ncbi:VENN motif pre-toxin domain-containing protein, partial [Snodgrassella gandavensis]|uniref:VENN motif pre-toxin domain-containing protein n=1 Tax=Snodgrassella gandavensis TaxID=2946698 RepID=UPI001EF46DF1
TLSADMARKANQERQQAREKAEQELQTNNPELWQDYNGRSEAEKQKILHDISKDYRAADEQAQSWGIGGGKSRALNAVTSAVTGILGGQTNLQAATNALAPYAAELIGKQFGHGDNQNQAAQLVAHALLGAISASVNGGNAAAGAVGASAAELAAQYLIKQLPKDQYPEAIDPRTGEIDPNRLPESVKASIRDLSSAVATVSGGLTGGSLVNAQIAGVVGQNAAENNELQQRSGVDRNYNYIEEDIKRIDRIKSRVCNGGMSSEACTQAVLTDIKKGNDQSLKQLIDVLTFIPAIGYVDSGNILINGQSLSGDEVNRLWGALGFVSFGYGQKLNMAGKTLGKIWRAIKPGEDLVTSTGHVIKNAEANAIKSESRGVGKEAGKEAANAGKGANGQIIKNSDGLNEVKINQTPLEGQNRLNTPDLGGSGKLKPAEAASAAQLEPVLGKMERYTPPHGATTGTSPDFVITSGPNKGKTVDAMYTTDKLSQKEIDGLNKFYEKNMTSGSGKDVIQDHLMKADFVPVDFRVLTPANQRIFMNYIKTLPKAQQDKIIIMR